MHVFGHFCLHVFGKMNEEYSIKNTEQPTQLQLFSTELQYVRSAYIVC